MTSLLMVTVLVIAALGCSTQAADFYNYAFSVQYGGASSAGAAHTKILFNVIRRNDANAYSATSGEFTAPVKGVYSLQFSASSASSLMYVYLHSSAHAGNWLASATAGSINTQASNQVIVELPAGAKVSVQLNPGHGSRSCSPPCSTFSGYLLYPLQP